MKNLYRTNARPVIFVLILVMLGHALDSTLKLILLIESCSRHSSRWSVGSVACQLCSVEALRTTSFWLILFFVLFRFQDELRVPRKWKASIFVVSFFLGGFGRIGFNSFNQICMSALRFKNLSIFRKCLAKRGGAHNNTATSSEDWGRRRLFREIYSRENLNSYPSHGLHKERKICPFSTQSRNNIGRYSGSLDKRLRD